MRTWLYSLFVIMALIAAIPTATSCGAVGARLVVGDGYYDPFYGDYGYYYNGDWRGEYVYYRGRWHYHGIGTPYIWDPYPWWY